MGKSTAILNLACATAGHGVEVAVLDLDPQASVGRWVRTRRRQHRPLRIRQNHPSLPANEQRS